MQVDNSTEYKQSFAQLYIKNISISVKNVDIIYIMVKM